MATVIQETAVDDIDGTEGDGVLKQRFALDGVGYEIDLTEAHRAELATTLAPWIAAARVVVKAKRKAAAPSAEKSTLAYRQKVRAWAALTGWWALRGWTTPPQRGQLPKRLLADYEAKVNG